MARSTLTLRDDRTGTEYVVPIEGGAIRGADLGQIRVGPDDPGLLVYDPALEHTAICRSAISAPSVDRAALHLRGYAIEELATRSTFLETAYLIVKGELPTAERFRAWRHNVTHHTLLHEGVKRMMDCFRYDASPMSVFTGTIASLAAFYPDARAVRDLESRRMQTRRLIGKAPTIAAFAYRRSRGLPYVYPNNELSYAGNFLSMMFKMTELDYRPNPVVEHALDMLFILYADHGQNCSTAAARIAASSDADPYSVVAAAAAAMAGPGHGGQSEVVLRRLREIGSVERVPDFIANLEADPRRLAGIGHRFYHTRDPRVDVLRPVADEVFAEVGEPPLLPIAREVERRLADSSRLRARGLFPTVDFYAALVYDALGIPGPMFPVLYAMARVASWMAQWAEHLADPGRTVAQPQQVYVGHAPRPYVPMAERRDVGAEEPVLHGPL